MVEKRPVGRPETVFTSEEKSQALAILALNEGNLKKSARDSGLTPYKLRKIRDSNIELYHTIQRRVAEGLLDKTLLITSTVLDEIYERMTDPEHLESMKTKDLMIISGIGVDKVNVMTTVRGKFAHTQKAAEDYSQLSDEELQEVIEAEYTELVLEEETDNEGSADTPEDELHAEKRRFSPAGSILHRSRSPEEP